MLVAASCLGADLAAQKPDNAADTARLTEVLNIRPGSHVADIGAGSGELTVPMARVIGQTGRVYATDVNPERLQELRALSPSDNIVVIEGGSARTNLPDECCDALFIRHVYHHFGDPAAMNASVLRAEAGRASRDRRLSAGERPERATWTPRHEGFIRSYADDGCRRTVCGGFCSRSTGSLDDDVAVFPGRG